jgi:hypothetical protein
MRGQTLQKGSDQQVYMRLVDVQLSLKTVVTFNTG